MTVGCKWLNGVEGFKLIRRLEISIKGFGSSFQYMSQRSNYAIIVIFLSEKVQVHLKTPSLYFGSYGISHSFTSCQFCREDKRSQAQPTSHRWRNNSSQEHFQWISYPSKSFSCVECKLFDSSKSVEKKDYTQTSMESTVPSKRCSSRLPNI